MLHKDPLQYNQTLGKQKTDEKLIAIIVLSILCVTEFLGIMVLLRKNTTPVETTTELVTEAVAETVTDVATEEIPVTEEITEAVTEASTEEVTEALPEDFTTKEYYPLFAAYTEKYNAKQLAEAINSAYLLELREVILNQTMQGINAADEPGYWESLMAQYGGDFTTSLTLTSETVLGDDVKSSLAEQLSAYGFTGAIEQAVSVSATQAVTLVGQDVPCAQYNNKYVVIKTEGAWWIVGKQAE